MKGNTLPIGIISLLCATSTFAFDIDEQNALITGNPPASQKTADSPRMAQENAVISPDLTPTQQPATSPSTAAENSLITPSSQQQTPQHAAAQQQNKALQQTLLDGQYAFIAACGICHNPPGALKKGQKDPYKTIFKTNDYHRKTFNKLTPKDRYALMVYLDSQLYPQSPPAQWGAKYKPTPTKNKK